MAVVRRLVGHAGYVGEHGAVQQVVPVHDVVRVREVGPVPARKEHGAIVGHPPAALVAVEVARQVRLVVPRMHDGVVHLGPRHVDPAHDVGVDGTQRVPVHRQVRKRRARDVLRRVEGLFRQRIVGVLALPVGKRDGAERRQGEHEHHEGHPEDDAPGAAPLPAPAFLGHLGHAAMRARPAAAAEAARLHRTHGTGARLRGVCGRPDLMRLRGAGSRPGLPRPPRVACA